MIFDTHNTSAFNFTLLSRSNRAVSATANVPIRLSNARPTASSFRNNSNCADNVIGSPTRTLFSASARLPRPYPQKFLHLRQFPVPSSSSNAVARSNHPLHRPPRL